MVATTSWAVAATLGYEDEERAPACLWELNALRRFMSEVSGPVNITREPTAPSIAELSALGVARVSWGPLLQWDAMARFREQLASLRD